MRSRTRIAAVGLVVVTLLCAVSSTAGARDTRWSTRSNGGFVSLDLRNTAPSAGLGSEAAADNAPPANAARDVTAVPGGEYRSGALVVFLIAGMTLAGLVLIGRHRIVSFARSQSSSDHRRGGS
jgi:hypothetical protein